MLPLHRHVNTDSLCLLCICYTVSVFVRAAEGVDLILGQRECTINFGKGHFTSSESEIYQRKKRQLSQKIFVLASDFSQCEQTLNV